jgi:hypothetical protein
MRSPTITPPTARVDAPRSSPPPGASPGDFAALLDQTTARTASAEGPQTRPARAEPSRRRPEDSSRQDEAATATATATDQATAGEERPAGPPAIPAPAAGERLPGADGQAASDVSDPDAPPTLYTAVDPTAMGAAVLPGVADPTVPGAGPPGLADPTVAPPLSGAATGPGGAAGPAAAGIPVVPVAGPEGEPVADGPAGAPAGGLAIPAELLGAGTGADAEGQDGRREDAPGLSRLLEGMASDAPASSDAPTATAAPASSDAPTATAAPATPPAGAPATAAVADTAAAGDPAAAPTVTPVVGQPAATPSTAVPVAAGAPQLTRASVSAAAEHVQDLVRIATLRNGGARATLQLKPVELGAVDVHLRTTREGLVATIAAHDQVGLDALQQAGDDLRRSLEDRGVQLHRLDLQLSSGQGGFGNGADARQASSGSSSRRAGTGTIPGAQDEATEDLTISTVTSTPAGALVDVQA